MRLVGADGVGTLAFIHVRKVAREQRADVHPVFAVDEYAVALVLQVTMYLKKLFTLKLRMTLYPEFRIILHKKNATDPKSCT